MYAMFLRPLCSQGSEPDFYVLAVHSFMEGILRNRDSPRRPSTPHLFQPVASTSMSSISKYCNVRDQYPLESGLSVQRYRRTAIERRLAFEIKDGTMGTDTNDEHDGHDAHNAHDGLFAGIYLFFTRSSERTFRAAVSRKSITRPP